MDPDTKLRQIAIDGYNSYLASLRGAAKVMKEVQTSFAKVASQTELLHSKLRAMRGRTTPIVDDNVIDEDQLGHDPTDSELDEANPTSLAASTSIPVTTSTNTT
jgi:hypothetical protein